MLNDSSFETIILLILTAWGLATAIIVFFFTVIHVCLSEEKYRYHHLRAFCCRLFHRHKDDEENEKFFNNHGDLETCYWSSSYQKLPFIDEYHHNYHQSVNDNLKK